MKPLDLPVLAAMAAGCKLHAYYKNAARWSPAWSHCALIHPDGRRKDVSTLSIRRLIRSGLIGVCAQEIGAFDESYDYAITANGFGLAETCTKSLEEIFKPRKAAKAAQPQETT